MSKFNSLLLIAGFVSLTACQNELNPDKVVDGEHNKHVVRLHATVDTPTKATLTDDYDANNVFNAGWESGDYVTVDYGSSVYADAAWNQSESVFEGDLVDSDGNEVYAYFPQGEAIECLYNFDGTNREQNGNKYNSNYDLMYSNPFIIEKDVTDVTVQMNRATAIQYFNLTAGVGAEWVGKKIVSATLSVTGENAAIAAESVMMDGNGDLEFEGGQKSIKLSFPEETAPIANNLQLWFNVLPCDVESMTISVVLEDGYTWTKTNTFGDKGYTFEAGKLGYVKGAPTYEKAQEDITIVFKSCNSETSDSSTPYTTSSNLSDVFSDGVDYIQSITQTNNVYAARSNVGGVKFGNSSTAGAITFTLKESIKVSSIIVNAAPYNDTEGQSGLLVNGNEVDMSQGTKLVLADYEIDLNEDVSSITITHTARSRVFVRAITLVPSSGPVVTKYNVRCSATGGTVTASPSKAAEGATVTLTTTPLTGKEFSSLSVKNASTNEEISKTEIGDGKFTFVMPAADVTVNATFVGDQKYVITFGNNASSATGITASTKASTVISNGTDYVTASPFTINSGNVYYGDTKTCIRLGKSGNASSLSIALSDAGKVKAKSIVVNCKNYGGSKNTDAKLNVNNIGEQTTTTDADDYTFTFGTATDITTLTLAADKAIYVYSITVNY